MPRVLDLIAIAAVAVVVLLPKASVEARPALEGDPMELDRVAELQDDLLRQPDDIEAALKLADSYLSFFRSDWAIASLDRFKDRGDCRVHLTLATAHAERLEPTEAVAESKRVFELCGGANAGPACAGATAKAQLLEASMKALLDGKIDPAKDPVAAKDAVYKALHPTKYNLMLGAHPQQAKPAPTK
jgi:hypothetical protein